MMPTYAHTTYNNKLEDFKGKQKTLYEHCETCLLLHFTPY